MTLNMPDAFPLQWPKGVKRTLARDRKRAKFSYKKRTQSGSWSEKLSVHQALTRVADELRKLGARYEVVSTNLRLRIDRLPRSDQREPDDPGAAIYFMLKQVPHCMPCDRWDRVADNIAAIAAHIDAVRRIERYGVSDVAQSLAGFRAELPSADGLDWRRIFGDVSSAAEVKTIYHKLATKAHPDHGGSHIEMSRLAKAFEAALKELQG